MIDELGPRLENKKVLILGIGNRQRGDEGVGCFLIKRLQGKVNVPLIDGGLVPEKHLRAIENVSPDVVLIIAAARIPDAAPGDIALFQLDELRPAGVFTPAADLLLFFKVFPKDFHPDTLLIAVQTETDQHQGVSDSVRVALDGLEALCVELFG